MSFIIVRHPFERLLSAYRDKLQYALPHTFHQKLGNMIVRKFRKALTYERGDNTHHPLMNTAHHAYLQSKSKKVGTRWPTFSEFVEFLLFESGHDSDLDMHWTPIADFCTPCQVRFDLILKFETLDDDQRYLIDKAGLSALIKPEHKNSGKGQKNTNELLMNYYGQLTKSQVKGLYQVFRHDFEIFDYSPQEYLDAAQEDGPDDKKSEGVENVELNIDRSKLLPFS